jgi:ParB family transcriptional regulator, chromosome partitioning protein
MLAVEERTEVRIWPIDALRPSEHNPRGPVSPDDQAVRDLADSILEHGILQPLVCTPDGEVLIGHRRLAASKLAGLQTVPVIVRPVANYGEIVEIQLVENLQRADLSPMQEARAYYQLQEMGLSNAQIATRTGVKQARITYRLQLLQLDARLQDLVDSGDLPIASAQYLVRVTDHDLQRKIGLLAIKRHWTSSRVDEIIERELAEAARDKKPQTKLPNAVRFAPGSLTRRAAQERLRQMSDVRATYYTLADVMRQACEGDCGVERDGICAECPLLLMVGRLLARREQ